MIKFKKILMPVFAMAIFLSCNKTDYNYPEGKVGDSRITYFPILTMNGANIIAVANGSAFTDPGATAKVGGADVPVTISGTPDINTDGVYTITYSAVNADGFAATATRNVAVYTTAPDAAANDLSGHYKRDQTGVDVFWEKIAPGVYVVTNPGGAATGGGLIVVAFNPSAYDIHVPEQRSSDGNISSTANEVFTPGAPDTYLWNFLNPGYGTQVRNYTKQ